MRLMVSGLSWRMGIGAFGGQTPRPASADGQSSQLFSQGSDPDLRLTARYFSAATRSRVMTLASSTAGWSNGIDAQQARGENRLQHEMHHQRPDAPLVKPGEIEGAHRPAGLPQRLAARPRPAPRRGRRPCGRRGSRGRPWRRARATCAGPSPAEGARTMLIRCSRGPSMNSCSWLCWSTGPRQAIGRRALAVLAEALRPQLREPVREAPEPVGVGHHHLRRGCRARAPAPRRSPRPSAGAKPRGDLAAISASTTSRAPARTARASRPRAIAGSRPTLVKHREAPADARVVVEDGDAVRLEQRAQAVGLAGDARAR